MQHAEVRNDSFLSYLGAVQKLERFKLLAQDIKRLSTVLVLINYTRNISYLFTHSNSFVVYKKDGNQSL
jgi:hypothetical protein